MDPTATYAVVLDTENVTLTERAMHALDLLVWITQGGHLPGKQTVGNRNQVVEVCERVITHALDPDWLAD